LGIVDLLALSAHIFYARFEEWSISEVGVVHACEDVDLKDVEEDRSTDQQERARHEVSEPAASGATP